MLMELNANSGSIGLHGFSCRAAAARGRDDPRAMRSSLDDRYVAEVDNPAARLHVILRRLEIITHRQD
jgi:hypothetical protein